jgi:hypothetical protein
MKFYQEDEMGLLMEPHEVHIEIKDTGDTYYVLELMSILGALYPCETVQDVETVFGKYAEIGGPGYGDPRIKIFLLYAGIGECYTPDQYTLEAEDEYVLALGRYLKSWSKIQAGKTGMASRLRELLATVE